MDFGIDLSKFFRSFLIRLAISLRSLAVIGVTHLVLARTTLRFFDIVVLQPVNLLASWEVLSPGAPVYATLNVTDVPGHFACSVTYSFRTS